MEAQRQGCHVRSPSQYVEFSIVRSEGANDHHVVEEKGEEFSGLAFNQGLNLGLDRPLGVLRMQANRGEKFADAIVGTPESVGLRHEENRS
jgi:hypothetical protein